MVARTAHFALHRLVFGLKSVSDGPLFEPVDDIWIGALVPKRWAKRSVTRNAIRRQVYAVGHDAASGLACAAYVVRLRSGFDRRQFVSASSDALKLAVRVELQTLFAQPQKVRGGG